MLAREPSWNLGLRLGPAPTVFPLAVGSSCPECNSQKAGGLVTSEFGAGGIRRESVADQDSRGTDRIREEGGLAPRRSFHRLWAGLPALGTQGL